MRSGTVDYLYNGRITSSEPRCRLPFQTYEAIFLSKSSDPDSSSTGRLPYQDPFNKIELKTFVESILVSFPKNDTVTSKATIEYIEISELPGFLSTIVADFTLGIIPYSKDRISTLTLTIVSNNKISFQQSIRADWTVYVWIFGTLLGFPLFAKPIEDRQKEIIESTLPALINQSSEKLYPGCMM